MLLLALLNCLLGVVFGLLYRVMILAPLIAIAVLEATLVALPAGTWISVLWRSGILIASLEIGYFGGSAISVYLGGLRFPTHSPQLENAHSVHGFVGGAVRKKLGLALMSEKANVGRRVVSEDLPASANVEDSRDAA